jgi:hypothetical protein
VRKKERERERERESTCIIFKSMMAQLFTVLMVAVAMESVELVRGGGCEE